jgi:multidrug resistance efflux pump
MASPGATRRDRSRPSMARESARAIGRIFDGMRASPLGIVVFACSVALLVWLQMARVGSIRADAVAQATHIDQPAQLSSYVTTVYVHVGEQVESGAPLLDLSPVFIDRELEIVGAEIDTVSERSALEQARLVIEEQRWVRPEMRLLPDRPSLERPTEAVFAKELALLQTRRRQLLEDRLSLTVRSNANGRVVSVAAPGSSVAAGTAVASLSPAFAEEIVAYVPATTQPQDVAIGTQVLIEHLQGCRGAGRVLRRGAAVEEAPRQLSNFFRFPVYGMPVFISVPSECRLGIGQVLKVEFDRAAL